MTTMNQYCEKFQGLLRELFQFDCAELDFGIYRIMNYKRDVIEKFISIDLPKAIAEELDRGALAEQSQAAAELKEVATQIKETLGDAALDADGRLAEAYHATPLGKKYLSLKAKAAGGRGREALEAAIYNHLYAFFSRYYQDGDFISKRRYSKKERYAIPYNGDEVYLYWANHDQYYVKTAEYFHDYTWKAPNGVTVHFKLQQADVEQNNVKGDKRFFLPRLKEIAWDEKAGQVVIPFEYRPLTEQETIAYGQKNQQDAIIAETLAEIPKRLSPKTAGPAVVALSAEKRKNADGQPVTFFEHHLRQYTRRNTADFFIHKDLKGFLSRELDFYLKNEVLNLDEMEATGEERAEGWFQMMRVIKAVGGRIIEFLHQIEEFQKMLWEKRKFITETQYCITVGNIDESFYGDIAACDAQWGEWKELFHIDEETEARNLFNAGAKNRKDRRVAFLKSHPTLVLDTRHFDRRFVDRLLGSIDDLDGRTDGLLVHSENSQALNVVRELFKRRVACVHIDPPYNTQTSGFLYKNDYQHSSWLAMMAERISLAWETIATEGNFLVHIDENEQEHLHVLCNSLQLPSAGTTIWDKKNPMLGRKGIATQHEYILWRTRGNGSVYLRNVNQRMILDKAREIIQKYGAVTQQAKREFAEWVASCPGLSGGERAYRFLDDDGRVYQSASLAAPEPRTDPKFFKPLVHPITRKPCPVPPNGWSRAPETMQQLLNANAIIFGADETVQPRRKIFLTEESQRQVSSVIEDAGRGKSDVDRLGLEFPYCHPVSLYVSLLGAAASDCQAVVLDFFAGSGTTGHAAINLNREDGGSRKFILVEMADYFDTVLLPRIKKVTFTPEWKDGKPKRMATQEEFERGPRIVKYIRLESYEDALNNIEFDDASGQQVIKFEDYLLKYMLKWETKHSATLLNIEKLARPFSYKLLIHADGQTQEKVADVPETFNYLLGLEVQTRKVYDDDGRRYLVYRGQTREGRQVAVIWRETEGWQKEDYERDKKFVAEQKLTDGADEVFINGDSFIPNAKALEPVFKARMFAPVEA
jgi:adenine-specific DNA-methyltransferase